MQKSGGIFIRTKNSNCDSWVIAVLILIFLVTVVALIISMNVNPKTNAQKEEETITAMNNIVLDVENFKLKHGRFPVDEDELVKFRKCDMPLTPLGRPVVYFYYSKNRNYQVLVFSDTGKVYRLIGNKLYISDWPSPRMVDDPHRTKE
jgi:hypothetical protein